MIDEAQWFPRCFGEEQNIPNTEIEMQVHRLKKHKKQTWLMIVIFHIKTQKENNFNSDCIWWRKCALCLMIAWKNCSALSCDKRRDEQAQSPGKRKPSAFPLSLEALENMAQFG